MASAASIYAFVSYPDAPYTENLIKTALAPLGSAITIHHKVPSGVHESEMILQWCTYDEMSHELTLENPQTVLSSCYAIRKSLIRKHFLHRAIQEYIAKNPQSPLKQCVPATWDLDIAHSDELDEMWVDDLYDLAQILPDESPEGSVEDEKWFILKPGMADRGMGIRLFRSKGGLQRIFDSFEADSSDSDDEETGRLDNDTNVVTSQLRHFVIQEYLPKPVLIDPRECFDRSIPASELGGRKFHLRAYCVAKGALKVQLATRILALFSSSAYKSPCPDDEASSNLSAHLTNTALQESRGEENVRLLQELVGCTIFPPDETSDQKRVLSQADVDSIVDNVATCIGEVFKAALNSAIHFQTLPNAFELFGADLLLTWNFRGQGKPSFQISLLELNAEPAIHLTGPRLDWILKELFSEIAETCVAPFFPQVHVETAQRKGDKSCLRSCLDVQVRGAGGWNR